MITDCRKLFTLSGDQPTVLTLDLVRRRSFLSESASDYDGIPIQIVPISFLSLIFEVNRYFRSTSLDASRRQREGCQMKGARTVGLLG
jgi:hypothetical protein